MITACSSVEVLASTKASDVDFAPGIEVAFPSQFEEYDCFVEASGALPEYLRGTYYLNGPASFGKGGLSYRHWLDGDGMICSLRFTRDEILLKQRYIRSRKFEEERIAGRPLFRTFGTTFPGDRLNQLNNGLESPVNISVYPYDGRLLAFGEQTLPWEVDPETLETRGQFTWGGRLNQASPFSAHPKIDPASGGMFNFGVFFSPQAPRLYFYCLGIDGLRYRTSIPLDYLCFVHDFTLSGQYAVFYLSPYLLNVTEILRNGLSVMDSLRWEPERGSRLLVLSRENGSLVASIPVGHRYCLHLINSYEEGGRLTVDVLEFDEPLYRHYQPMPSLFRDFPSGGPVRFVIDMSTWELIERVYADYQKAPDFPAIDSRLASRPYEEFWTLGISATGRSGRKFFDQLVHVNWSQPSLSNVYQSPPMRYLGGEPVFVGCADASEGVIICQEFNAASNTSSFLIFNSKCVHEGPISRIELERPVHLGFHAAFSPARKG